MSGLAERLLHGRRVLIDRPKGFKKVFTTPRGPEESVYPVDYGFLADVVNPDDNEGLDVFLGSGGPHHGRFMKGKTLAGSWEPDERKWYAGLDDAELESVLRFYTSQDPTLLRDHMTFQDPQAWLTDVDSVGVKRAALQLAGELQGSSTGYLLLQVPNALATGAFYALPEVGLVLPGFQNKPFSAHITVMRPDELKGLGGLDRITERGKSFEYSITGGGSTASSSPMDVYSRYWYLAVTSPALSKLRRSYGLPGEPSKPFHITIAARPRYILGENRMSKLDGMYDD